MKVLDLAIADLRHDALHFTCAVILIAAITGPFLVLLGIKVGVISVLLSDLRDDPGNLEVFIQGAHEFTEIDIDRVRGLDGVAFAEGQNLVTTTGRLRLQRAPDGPRSITGGYGTTGPGDPLTAMGGTLDDRALILSGDFAGRLGVTAGSQVSLILERGPPFEGAATPVFDVAEVLDPARVSGSFVLLTADALSLVEAYGFGYAIPDWGISEGYDLADRQDKFEKIRIYADSLGALPALVPHLEAELEVRTQSNAREVKVILDLERNLGAALSFVSGAALIGLFFVLVAHFWGAVKRKRLNWSMLCLMGSAPVALAAVPVTQALFVSMAGYLGGLVIYFGLTESIDAWFRPFLGAGQRVAVLPTEQAISVGFLVVVVATAASAAAGYSVLRTDPAEIIRSS